ncbi:MAG: hypothetical protein AAB225_03685, partial [Acidobacteriota bacterium]
MQKTLQRQAVTLAHGRFRLREVVYVCDERCEREGLLVTRRAPALRELVPPKSTVGYDVLVYVGIERFVGHRPREEIRATLEKEHGIHLSSGEISELGQRFLLYLEALHRDSAPALRAALAADGGWPLHLDATKTAAARCWSRWPAGAVGSWGPGRSPPNGPKPSGRGSKKSRRSSVRSVLLNPRFFARREDSCL